MWQKRQTKKQKSYDSFDDIFSLAINILSRTDLTVRALREKLLLKTTKINEINLVIDRLLELGLLNDADRAKAIIDGHPLWSKLRLKQALYEKGVPSFIANEALDNIDRENEINRCKRAYKKAKGYKELTDENKVKLFNSMLRHGFNADIIRSVIDIDEIE